MRIKLTKKLIAAIVTLVLLAVMVPVVAAYEAHVVDVKAHVTQLPPATRTWGWWKTHLDYTTVVFNVYLDGEIDIGCWDILTMEDMMGIFWAHSNKEANGDDRDDLCKERLKTARKTVAAILNSNLPNGPPLPVELSYIQSTLCGTDIDALKELHDLLNSYNEYYDGETILECDYYYLLNITCRNKCLEDRGFIIDYEFADCTPECPDCP